MYSLLSNCCISFVVPLSMILFETSGWTQCRIVGTRLALKQSQVASPCAVTADNAISTFFPFLQEVLGRTKSFYPLGCSSRSVRGTGDLALGQNCYYSLSISQVCQRLFLFSSYIFQYALHSCLPLSPPATKKYLAPPFDTSMKEMVICGELVHFVYTQHEVIVIRNNYGLCLGYS